MLDGHARVRVALDAEAGSRSRIAGAGGLLNACAPSRLTETTVAGFTMHGLPIAGVTPHPVRPTIDPL